LHYPCHAFLIDLRYDTTRLVELLPLVERLVQANTPTASAIFDSGVNCFCRILRKQNTTMPSLLILLRLYRHLNESQRGMVAAKLETLKQGRPNKDANLHDLQVSRSDAADMLNVSPRTVAAASKVQAEAPTEVIHAVEAGTVSINRATQFQALPERRWPTAQPSRNVASRFGRRCILNHGLFLRWRKLRRYKK